MSDFEAPNRFTPPRAVVDGRPNPGAEAMVLAEPATRLLAYLLDMLPGIVIVVVILAAMLPALWPAMASGHFEEAMRGGNREALFMRFGGALLFSGALAVGWGIYNIILVYRYGQSWGKKMMAIRMVRTDGSRMSFARYFFLRCLVYGILCAIPFVGWPLRLIDKLLIFRDSRQCLHDSIADTTVATAESSTRATLAGSRVELPTINF